MDIQERLTAFAMLGAGWVMWLLVILSVIGLAIILERAYYLFTSRDDSKRLQDALRKALGEDDVDTAIKALADSRSFEAKVAHSGLDIADQGPDAVDERMTSEMLIAKGRMERNLAFLGTVGNNAPFVGLLGTVIGVIRSFQALDQSAGQVTSGLMTEVGEALVATAIGILVALPAVAAYNYFMRVIKGRMNTASAMSHDVLSFLKAREHLHGGDGPYRGDA